MSNYNCLSDLYFLLLQTRYQSKLPLPVRWQREEEEEEEGEGRRRGMEGRGREEEGGRSPRSPRDWEAERRHLLLSPGVHR